MRAHIGLQARVAIFMPPRLDMLENVLTIQSLIVTLVVLTTLSSASHSLIAGDAFLAGDAFFLSQLGEEATMEWKPFVDGETDSFVLKYHPPVAWNDMCGECGGYEHLRIDGISREQVRSLIAVYDQLRREPSHSKVTITYFDIDGSRKTKEQEPFYLFVYNRGFGGGLGRLGSEGAKIGVLYNEDWMRGGEIPYSRLLPEGNQDKPYDDKLVRAPGGMGGQAEGPGDSEPEWRYRAVLRGSGPIIEDWKYSREVAGLAVQGLPSREPLPELDQNSDGELSIGVADVQFIIVAQASMLTGDDFLKGFYNQEDWPEVIICVDDKIERYRWVENSETGKMELEASPLQLDSQ